MEYLRVVHHLEGLGKLNSPLPDPLGIETKTILEEPPKGLSLQVLVDDEGNSLGLSRVIHRSDIGMSELRGNASLARKSLRNAGSKIGQELERHLATQAAIGGEQDPPEGALSELGFQPKTLAQ
jgi:hypothetical protein